MKAESSVLQLARRAFDAYRAGRRDDAKILCERHIRQHSQDVGVLHLLGSILLERRELFEAASVLERAVSLSPRSPTLHNSLGVVHFSNRDFPAALRCFTVAIQLDPERPDQRLHQGLALASLSRHHEAAEALECALHLGLNSAEAHSLLADSYFRLGRFADAERACRRALNDEPCLARAHACLGAALLALGRLEEAVASLRQAVALTPDFADAHARLGAALTELCHYTEAKVHYLEAARLAPDDWTTLNNLAACCLRQASFREGRKWFRQALRLNPKAATMRSNYIFSLNYDLALSSPYVYSAHRSWSARHEAPLIGCRQPHTNDADPARRVRVGYVSGELDGHPTSFFIEPLLAPCRSDRFEIFFYVNGAKSRETTQRLRRAADQWQCIHDLSDEETAQQIRRDHIDILVDLAGHSGGNRLPVFARKPAPVQVTYLGYPNTTGMSGMDYRITDGRADPPGLTETFHTEEIARLPGVFLCYQPPLDAPEVGALAADRRGLITFGSFNIRAKITPAVVSVWASILTRVPNSMLFAKAFSFGDEGVRERLYRQFRRHGITRERVELVGPVRSHREHLAMYQEVDIALDTFPYNGTTTTCEALWMGAPVLALKGRTHVSRVGYSLLSAVGLQEFVAVSENDYVERAVRIAADTDRLRELRSGLRERLWRSPLLDQRRFIKKLETQYRRMWHHWCVNLRRY